MFCELNSPVASEQAGAYNDTRCLYQRRILARVARLELLLRGASRLSQPGSPLPLLCLTVSVGGQKTVRSVGAVAGSGFLATDV
jgi:hypothetical protein